MTVTRLTEKFRKDVERVSQDRVRGEIVRRLRVLFASVPKMRRGPRLQERARCIAEIRRIQKRNTETSDGRPNTWNRAVKTMADECIDAITNG